MTTAIGSGPLIPVVSSPSSPVQAGPALPVYVYTSLPAGRSQSGAKPIPVKFLSASDLVQNGGSYTLAGPPTALPVISVAANVYGVQGGSALPVYDVTNLVYPQPQPNPPSTLPVVASATLLLNLQADTLALADGDPVSTWANTGSLGGDFTQTGSARPTKHSTSGVPYVQFDGLEDYMEAASAINNGLDDLASFTVFIAAKLAGDAACLSGVIFLSKISDITAGAGWTVGSGTYWMLAQEAGGNVYSYLSVVGSPFGSDCLLAAEFTDKNDFALRINASAMGTMHNENGPVGDMSTTEPVRIAADGDLGNQGFSGGNICAVMVYAPAPNASDRAAIEAWLAAKYGITL